MLLKLREQTQNTGFKILVGAIIVVLALFGFGATNLFSGADPQMAKVGSVEITQSLLSSETERERRRLLSQMGADFDPSSIDRLELQRYVLQQLISRQTMYQTTAELGVRVAPERINSELVNSPAYQIDGTFNEVVYRQQVQALGYSPLEFIEEFTAALSVEQMRAAIVDSVVLPDWELAEIIRIVSQRRDIAYLPLTLDLFESKVQVSDEDVALRYEENQSSFMTPLSVDASYIRLSSADLVQDASIVVTDEELRSLYDDERALALADEQRDSAHILIQINDERNSEQALALIKSAQERLIAGEDFAAVAAELSEDPGSAVQGGALGLVGKNIFDPAFEEALWRLEEVGNVSEPVLSSFGYHLIQLNEIVIPEYPTFAAKNDELIAAVRSIKADELFADRALELERAAYEERFSLAATAEALGLKLQSVTQLTLGSPTDDAVVSREDVQTALFRDDVLAGTNSEAIAISDTEVVIVRVETQYPPELMPLEDVSEQLTAAITQERALAEIEKIKRSALARLESGESVTEIAKSVDSQWRTYPSTVRIAQANSELPAAIRSAAFDLPRPSSGEKSVGSVALDDGAALITVTRVTQGDINATPQDELASLRLNSENRAASLDFQGFFDAAQARLGVSRGALNEL
ncbi:MAG: SurA N-terminal domain-containing protein [Pseudomonadales bacterium]|nr:SurA N-terminal domain-containing protein [Pseudomonadales bacterium]